MHKLVLLMGAEAMLDWRDMPGASCYSLAAALRRLGAGQMTVAGLHAHLCEPLRASWRIRSQ